MDQLSVPEFAAVPLLMNDASIYSGVACSMNIASKICGLSGTNLPIHLS